MGDCGGGVVVFMNCKLGRLFELFVDLRGVLFLDCGKELGKVVFIFVLVLIEFGRFLLCLLFVEIFGLCGVELGVVFWS